MDAEVSYFCCVYPNCHIKFPSLKSLILHMRFLHGAEKDAQLRCNLGRCNKIYTTSESYRKHVNRDHEDILKAESAECETVMLISGETSDSNSCQVMDVCSEESTLSESLSVSQIVQILSQNVTLFALRVREEHCLPKSVCTRIMSDMSSVFSSFYEVFCQFVLTQLEEKGIDISTDQSLHHFLTSDTFVDVAWENVKTGDNLRRYCLENLKLIEAEEMFLGVDEVSGKRESFQYVSVIKTLQHYVSHQDVFDSIKRYAGNYNDHFITDYTDGHLFKQHPFFQSHLESLRLHFYTDDLEVCNPLGAAKKQYCLTVLYYQVGNIEPKYRSSLSSIHVACVARSKLVKKYGLQCILEPLIRDIRSLEDTGMCTYVNGKPEVFYASIATLSADNLASHDVGGFRCCFNSGRICRYCMMCYKDVGKFSSESDVGFPVLRTPDEHRKQLAAISCDSSLASAYGVTKPSALNALPSFNPTTSLPPDIMHDVLEGVVPVVLKVCLRGLMRDGLLSVDVVNDRLKRFKFGKIDSKNIPPLLSKSFGKSSFSFAGSASQKWCLFRTLAFLIADLVPVGNKHWQLYLLCRQCVDIIFAPVISTSQCIYLDSLISDHHKLLIELAPQDFTPKCHFLVHYPRLMYQYGPLVRLWCMRFEAYHQYLKAVASRARNCKNICHTVIERNQMRKCLEQAGDTCLPSEELITSAQSTVALQSLPKSLHAAVASYFACPLSSHVVSLSSVTIDTTHYSVNNCFIVDVLDVSEPVFLEIVHILSFDGLYGLAGHMLTCTEFDAHRHAFAIWKHPEWFIIQPGTEISYHPLDKYTVLTEAGEQQLITLRNVLPC